MLEKKGICNLFYPIGEQYSDGEGIIYHEDPDYASVLNQPIDFDTVAKWQCNVKRATVTIDFREPELDGNIVSLEGYPREFEIHRTHSFPNPFEPVEDYDKAIYEPGITLSGGISSVSFQKSSWTRDPDEPYVNYAASAINAFNYYKGKFYSHNGTSDGQYIVEYTKEYTKDFINERIKAETDFGSGFNSFVLKIEPLELYFE